MQHRSRSTTAPYAPSVVRIANLHQESQTVLRKASSNCFALHYLVPLPQHWIGRGPASGVQGSSLNAAHPLSAAQIGWYGAKNMQTFQSMKDPRRRLHACRQALENSHVPLGTIAALAEQVNILL